MEIKDEKYSVKYDAETATVHCQGIMRLRSNQYEPITQLLNKVIALELPQITLNLRELKILNSAGITMLGSFVLNVTKKEACQLVLQCTKKTVWQERSVDDFSELMPTLQIEWEE